MLHNDKACSACRDAADAVRARDGYRFGRSRLRVEIARGAAGPPQAPPNWRQKGTGFRIVVEGLPRHASWQDLKVCCILCLPFLA
jgi:hypothetical protein